MIRNLWWSFNHARQQHRQHQEEQRDAEIRLLNKIHRLGHGHPLNLLVLVGDSAHTTSELLRQLDGLLLRGLIEEIHVPKALSGYIITDAGRRALNRQLAASA